MSQLKVGPELRGSPLLLKKVLCIVRWWCFGICALSVFRFVGKIVGIPGSHTATFSSFFSSFFLHFFLRFFSFLPFFLPFFSSFFSFIFSFFRSCFSSFFSIFHSWFFFFFSFFLLIFQKRRKNSDRSSKSAICIRFILAEWSRDVPGKKI